MSPFTADVGVERVITTDPKRAGALENDLRAKILDMLADEEMTIEEVHDELSRRGERKAETTVRHHVDVLQDAGMVEVSRLEEVSGGTRKHYRSNTRVFSYDLPETAEETLDELSEASRDELYGFVESVFDVHGDRLEAIAEEMKPCEYCSTQRYEAFLLRELLGRALTGLEESGELDDLLD